MIEFRHGGKPVRLSPGKTHTTTVGATYHDTPPEGLQALTAEIESGSPWREAVNRRYGEMHPWLARIVTDPSRDLFFRQNPPPPAARILDIGAGWGQHALPLAKSHAVTALEPTPERLNFIRAAAAQEGVAERITFLQADFLEIEFKSQFDLVTSIGVLEWVPKYRAGNPRDIQLQFLKRIRSTLSSWGKLVIGIENRFGLKYLLGANDDHIARPGIAVLDQELAQEAYLKLTGEALRVFTYTLAEYQSLLSEAGFSQAHFFAALPDYKVPQQIISLDEPNALDAFFLEGHFTPEHDGSNGLPLENQDELKSHYLSLAKLGISQAFAPSYFITAS